MTMCKRSLLALAVALTMALASLTGCAAQQQDASSGSAAATSSASASASSQSSDPATSEHIDVAVTIDASAAKKAGVDTSALDKYSKASEYQLTDGATAYDALVATGASLDGEPSYVTSIEGLAEGAAGKSSGWMYEVNGETPMVAANENALKSGDEVRWYYSSWE